MDNEQGFVFGRSTADANLIEKIKIDWVAGQVNVTWGEGEEIQFSESSNTGLDEKTAMVSKVDGNELIIRFAKDKLRFSFRNLRKILNISLPKYLKVLFVKNVSGGILVDGISAEEVDIDNVSGGSVTKNLAAPKVSFKSVSGGAKLYGTFDLIKGNSVSGSVEIVSSVCPSRVWIENVSGRNEVNIPENNGFAAEINSVSGIIKTDFDVQWLGKNMAYGDGSARFKLKNVSGSTSINRLR